MGKKGGDCTGNTAPGTYMLYIFQPCIYLTNGVHFAVCLFTDDIKMR